nr:MAG TPA: hypothetical protein [Caudoviricetes sp.]DAY72682.1 MAG TPA: hypothetical protein [Caudoviricetes sp.]DAY74809.1 MAG TPA: hypothetical protein [Caudoviricetes sp.]
MENNSKRLKSIKMYQLLSINWYQIGIKIGVIII